MKSIQRKTMKEEAVSPVVGVMLMLVVTIIIAAVVAAFAGGLAGNTDSAPNAIIKLDSYTFGTVDQSSYGTEWTTYKEGWHDYGQGQYGPNSNYGIYNMTFACKGGEPIAVSFLTLKMTYNGATYDVPFKDVVDDDVTTLSAGKTVELVAQKGGNKYVYGLGQQDMLSGPSYVDWEIMDNNSSYLVAKGRITFDQPTPGTS